MIKSILLVTLVISIDELDFVQGCSLWNTKSALGIVVFISHETKVGFFMQLCIKITIREHKG
jgi:hypothetical protein